MKTCHENAASDCFRPERSGQERWIALGVFVASCMYLRVFYDYSILNADEGIVLQGAQRILRGEVLYRDFFSFYTPGSYYWTAALFKIFGSSILVARAGLIVEGALFSALTYLLARRFCPRWSALLAVFMLTLTSLPYRFIALHNWDSTLLALLTLYCAVLWLETHNWAWAAGIGGFSALTCLFEQSKGAGLVFGLLIAGSALAIWGRQRHSLDRKSLTALAFGFAVPFTLTVLYFAANRGLYQMLTGWLWPLFNYTEMNRLPYGYLVMANMDRTAWLTGSWLDLISLMVLAPCILLPVLPLVGLGMLAWSAFGLFRNDGQKTTWHVLLISAVASGLLLSTFLTKRPDFTHLNYMAPFYYLVFAWLIGGSGRTSRLRAMAIPALVFVVCISYTASGLAALVTGPARAQHRMTTAHGAIRTTEPPTDLEFIRAHTMRGEKFLVYPYQPMISYLTETFSPTQFEYMQAGMHTPAQYEEALAQIISHPPRAVLLDVAFGEKFPVTWPNTPLRVIAAKDPVEAYLLEHYQSCRSLSTKDDFWHFVFMVQKTDTCPSDPPLEAVKSAQSAR